MGDMGAKMLAKALQINTKLRYAGQALSADTRMLAPSRALESSEKDSSPSPPHPGIGELAVPSGESQLGSRGNHFKSFVQTLGIAGWRAGAQS